MDNVEIPKLKKGEFKLPFPKEDPFIIYVNRTGMSKYKNLTIQIGIKSDPSNIVYLFKISTYYSEPVPFTFAELIWEKFYLYLYKYQDKAYRVIKYNMNLYAGFSKKIKLSYYFKKNKLYYFIDSGLDELVDLDKQYPELVDIYDTSNKDYMNLKYYRKFIPSKKTIEKCLNGLNKVKKKIKKEPKSKEILKNTFWF